MSGGTPRADATSWVPYLVSGTGAVLGAVLLLEVLAVLFGPAGAYDGFWVGVATAMPFILGLVYGGYWLFDSLLPRSDHPRIAAWFGAIALGTVLMVGVINVSMRSMTPLLAVGTVRWSAAIGGTIGLVMGVLQTRSIRRAIEAERARQQQRQMAQERDRLEAFATEISHDLRGPLNVARGHLDLLAADHDDPRIQQIATALDRMEPIIENTLTLARVGQTVGETETIELSDVATRSWETVESDGERLQIDGCAVFQADSDRLRHLFENLYRNAIDHGSGDVTIRVGVVPDAAGFYVEDDGPGIPEGERERVFESGYTTRNDGNGVGLSIVEQIADAHDWNVALSEGRDGGARFEITGVDLGPTEATSQDAEQSIRAT